MSAKKINLKKISVIIITTLLVFSLVSLGVTKFVYDGIFARYDEPAPIDQSLDPLVASRSEHLFPSGDNLLTGYHYSDNIPDPAHGLIVLVPGFNAGGDDYLWQISTLVDYGWSVFTFDATGSLRSEGDSQVGFSQPVLDLDAALDYVRTQALFGCEELILMGHSRGGYAVCCALAEEKDVAAVVSISGINSAMEGVMQMSANTVGPAAYGNYPFLWLYQVFLFGDDVLNLEAVDAISQSDVPVLVIHGTQDEQIPLDSCSVISYQDQIQSDRVEYLRLPAGHTDLMFDDDGTANDQLFQQVHEFLLRSVVQEP